MRPRTLLAGNLYLSDLVCDDFDEDDLLSDLYRTSMDFGCATHSTEDTTTSTLEL